MDEKEILLSRGRDAKNRAADNSMITNTNFLSVDERNVLMRIEREQNDLVKTFYYGGYEDAERTIAVFVPTFYGIDDIDGYFLENPDENPLRMIKISKDKFSDLSHRDYLGSIMGLGVKREMIGDIILCEDGCYVLALKSICGYISENLVKIGRGTVSCEVSEVSLLPKAQENAEISFSSVASLRLDNVVSAAFNLSRNISSEMIKSGLVYLNSAQVFKSDMLVREKDKVVLRGKGKAVLYEIIGESKKGRIHVNIKRFK